MGLGGTTRTSYGLRGRSPGGVDDKGPGLTTRGRRLPSEGMDEVQEYVSVQGKSSYGRDRPERKW